MIGKRTVHSAGALSVATLLGFACTQPDSRTSPDRLSFPEQPRHNRANDNRVAELPVPSFGPILASELRPTERRPARVQVADGRSADRSADRRTPLRKALLSTAGKAPLTETLPPVWIETVAVAAQFTAAPLPPTDAPQLAEALEADSDSNVGSSELLHPEESEPDGEALSTVLLAEEPFAKPVEETTAIPTSAELKLPEKVVLEPANNLPSGPSLAAAIPPKRMPIPMVTANPPRVEIAPPPAANDLIDTDAGDEQAVPLALLVDPLPLIVPPKRERTTLGLGQSRPQTRTIAPSIPVSTGIATTLVENRSARLSMSDEAPTLGYQDELILEIQVEGINASDTILAYGTRQGVYLPIGTLARILDLAITVGDAGEYATGWVLEPDRTLTIDLKRGILDMGGTERKLPPDAAVAFDGELYLLAERIADFLPLTVETDLRAQTITLTTLEPFPFEDRMRREADRARLANRNGVQPEKIFTRQDTPFLLASIPVGDVDLRTISDSAFGNRAEVDLQFAGDLGYLTAETFISADTINGLTTSLVKVGRQDPGGKLLGPLSATAFAAGDVATVSMPLGLRSVTGRGFAAANIPPETISVFEKIDLRGILADGFEVELYRNDILIESTQNAVNGQYEFLQVPVDFGVNVFRLVFFGPQGQRSEEVRRISVGDGRLPTGKLVYRFGAVQKDQNLLGVRPANFIAPRDFGSWRASGELSYGVSSDITAVVSGAWFETAEADNYRRTRWLSTAGIRTGLGGFALKADIGAGAGGALAISGGIGGRIASSAITVSHVEYSGGFIEETRGLGSAALTRATELDFNTTIELGNPISGFIIPVTARGRRTQTAGGLTTVDATLRASTRIAGVFASNTFDYSQTSFAGLESRSRLFGNLDLATLGRSRTRGRVSLGYQILPEADIVSAAVEVDHALDEDTAIRASIGYLFDTQSTQIGLSAVRDFDRFSVALDGSYAFDRNEYSIGLRLGFSFGRDPLRGGFFIARPGLANGGIASARAFRDLDGDGIFGPGDTALPDVSIIASNRTVPTDADGIAQLGNLSPGRDASLQIDASSLPDIDLAPANEGMQIVPRAGRIHVAGFPVVALSEVEGSLTFAQGSRAKGVSGVRLRLRDANGKDAHFSKTEIDGYFFFERVRPGVYDIVLDEEQAKRLDLCTTQDYSISVGYEADLLKTDVAIAPCGKIAVAAQ